MTANPHNHPTGVVYLLHFEHPYKHARHYIGWTNDLLGRLAAHYNGSGAHLLTVITEAGIRWTLVRTWTGTRAFERELKNRKEAPVLCPICNPHAATVANKNNSIIRDFPAFKAMQPEEK